MMRIKNILWYQVNIRRFMSFCLFMALLFILYSRITYLLKNTNYDCFHMIGLQNESNLDMIYVGGSSAFTY